MKLTVMQHADAEDLGVIKEWAADQGIEQSPIDRTKACLLYTSPSPRDQRGSRMPSSA
ncbi:glutamine amidotransferase [Lactobacillus rhamnosus GG] [Lacticaseibacillus rhamnosus]|nr:glutamine amidotransferase [Lactobacillus rhamnosus GG] [Lacticaseibacillus rhamnosus]